MKRTLIIPDLSLYPDVFHAMMEGEAVYDSSCSPEARVVFIDRDGGYYLKSAPKGTLEKEAQLDRYFHQKGLGAEVLEYLSDEKDWLLTARVEGEDCTHADYLSDPERLCDLLAERLRALHELDFSDCPVKDRMERYFSTVEENYRAGMFDLSYAEGYWKDPSAKELFDALEKGRDLFNSETLLHGDFCLPNIMLKDWRFSGFIDLGNGGVGDRHVDLYWGAWTLNFNLKTDAYRERFFDAYGRDRVEEELLRLVAAAEVFG